jgi:hypothetical protein
MAVDIVAEHTEPEPGSYDPIVKAQDNAALERWLPHHAALVGEIEGILRVHIHLPGLDGARTAEKAVRNAQRHDAKMATALDPTSHWAPGSAFGADLIALLVAFDVISLYWATQALDLDSSGTWLVTFILVAASPGILLQAAMLTTISVELVLCASAMLARPGLPALSHSRAARHARPDVAQARAAQQAAYALRRHLGGLRHILLSWAFGPAAPAGIDRSGWAALGMTIRRSFAAS